MKCEIETAAVLRAIVIQQDKTCLLSERCKVSKIPTIIIYLY